MTVYTARLAQSLGLKPAVVCRGYKGTYENSIGVASDGEEIFLDPDQCGDEPYLMASRLPGAPVVVGKDRYLSGKTAIELFNPDCIILDDAYQHLRLRRDVNLLLMDAEKPVGNGKIFPGGNLREPLSAIDRADALVITRSNPAEDKNRFFKENRWAEKIPVFTCRHVPGAVSHLTTHGFSKVRDIGRLAAGRFTAFSGIANNKDFKRLIAELGCKPSSFIPFPDHHKYSRRDILSIMDSAKAHGSEALVTTEKDAVKLQGCDFSPLKVYTVGVRISFVGKDEKRFLEFMKGGLRIRWKRVRKVINEYY
jgi:tetraacyldisaccharide 4'-kinase